MSIKLMSRAWEMELDVRQKFVLLGLCDAANDEGVCSPLLASIARGSRISVRTAQRVLADLEKAGLIARAYRSEESLPTRYTITLDGGEPNAVAVVNVNA